MNIIVFAGSAEARKWINKSRRKGYKLWVFLRSPAGRQLLPQEDDNLKIFIEGDSRRETLDMFPDQALALVDGSHPYDQAYSKRLARMAEDTGAEYIRLLSEERTPEGVKVFTQHDEARRYLERGQGNILFTTGLEAMERLISPRMHLRAYARTEPRTENIKRLRDQGLGYKQILALCGPFSQEMNQAMIGQYKIETLVTEESGLQDAVEEKAFAALRSGVELVVIRDSKKKGLYLHQIDGHLETLL